MALREILTQGDPALTKTCRPVEKFDRKLHDLLDDLKETLAESGAGEPGDCKPGRRAKRLGGLPQRPRKVWYGPAAQSGHRASPRPGRKFL